MSLRPTELVWALTTLCAWCVLLAVASGRPEILLVAVPAAVALASRRAPGGFDGLQLSSLLSADRINEGEELAFSITLRQGPQRAMVALLEVPSYSLTCRDGSNHRIVSFDDSDRIDWDRRFVCRSRGQFSLGDIVVRAWDWSGQYVLEARCANRQTFRVYPRLESVGPPPSPPHTQVFFGNRPSRRLGEGLEPAELRPFIPGDRIRRLNWRASLRRRSLYVTQFHEERNADVVLLLDSLSQVGGPYATSQDYSVRAAASLGTAYLRQRDRVGFIEYGGYLRWLCPAAGRRQAFRLLDTLLPSEVFFTFIGKDLALLPRQVLPPQALILAFSPLTDSRFIRTLEDLAARGFDLCVLSVSPVDLTRRVVGDGRIDRLALRFWALERRTQLDRLRRRGIPIVDWRPEEPLAAAVSGLSRRSLPLAHRT